MILKRLLDDRRAQHRSEAETWLSPLSVTSTIDRLVWSEAAIASTAAEANGVR
jgi:hypothetical protein